MRNCCTENIPEILMILSIKIFTNLLCDLSKSVLGYEAIRRKIVKCQCIKGKTPPMNILSSLAGENLASYKINALNRFLIHERISTFLISIFMETFC